MEFDSERIGLEKKFFDLCGRVVTEQDLVLYDLDYQAGPGELKVFIMNEETQSAVIDDCVRVDKALSPYIETEPWMPVTLTLEVSSPGVFRVLKTKEHFELAQGKKVSLVLLKSLDEILGEVPKSFKGQKRIDVQLVTLTQDGLEIQIDKNTNVIPFENIKKANLAADF